MKAPQTHDIIQKGINGNVDHQSMINGQYFVYEGEAIEYDISNVPNIINRKIDNEENNVINWSKFHQIFDKKYEHWKHI